MTSFHVLLLEVFGKVPPAHLEKHVHIAGDDTVGCSNAVPISCLGCTGCLEGNIPAAKAEKVAKAAREALQVVM